MVLNRGLYLWLLPILKLLIVEMMCLLLKRPAIVNVLTVDALDITMWCWRHLAFFHRVLHLYWNGWLLKWRHHVIGRHNVWIYIPKVSVVGSILFFMVVEVAKWLVLLSLHSGHHTHKHKEGLVLILVWIIHINFISNIINLEQTFNIINCII